MEHKRMFISAPVDPGLAKSLIKQTEQLNIPLENLRLVTPQNMHITLKFLGDTPLDKIDQIIKVSQEAVRNFGGFELEIEKTAIFPVTTDQTRPARVLNISFHKNAELQKLYEQIEESLWSNGLAHKENKLFTPHITIARVKKSTPISAYKKFLEWQPLGQLPIEYLELQESVLEKTGPSYFVLSTFDL